MTTLFNIYIIVCCFFAIATIVDFIRKETTKFKFWFTVWVGVFSFLTWPYGVIKAVKRWKKTNA